MRFEDTFGTHPDQVTDLARLYATAADTPGTAMAGDGRSVCRHGKHWPPAAPARQDGTPTMPSASMRSIPATASRAI